jgi:hypothetical protein
MLKYVAVLYVCAAGAISEKDCAQIVDERIGGQTKEQCMEEGERLFVQAAALSALTKLLNPGERLYFQCKEAKR